MTHTKRQTYLRSRQLSAEQLEAVAKRVGEAIRPQAAFELGLVTQIPDGLDWDDELRQAIETRTEVPV